jgi:hypothetical protein
MDKIVQELRKVIKFKSTTDIGDIVLVAVEKPQSVFYAIVRDISRDQNVKDEWWNVTLTILGVPLQKVTWTLRGSQFTGQEVFTMAGEGRFIQALDFSEEGPGGGLKRVPVKTGPKKKERGGLRRIK